MAEEAGELFKEFTSAGHHVYIAGQRGKPYSDTHSTIDVTANPEQYWDWTVEDIYKDTLAQGQAIASSFTEKAVIYGYGQGALSTIIGLTQAEQDFMDSFQRAVFFAPCTVGGLLPEEGAAPDTDLYDYITGALDYAVPDSIPSDNWQSDLDNALQAGLTYFYYSFSYVTADTLKTSFHNYIYASQLAYTNTFQSYIPTSAEWTSS